MENPRGLLMRSKRLIKFEEVCDIITRLADQNFPDKTVALKDIRVVLSEKDAACVNLEVPDIGVLELTDWSKRQLGSKLGITWDKWFNPDYISTKEIEEEMKRRFTRTGEVAKIRSRRFDTRTSNRKLADGYIRGVLSPSYSPIDDVRIFDRLRKNFAGQMSDFDFMQDRRKGTFYNDRASHYSIVSSPINMGPVDRKHRDARVRRFYEMAEREGKLPEEDWVYQGFHFRNSEVGYTAVTMDSSTFRLVCLNGAIVSNKDGRLLYRVHRDISDDAIDDLLSDAFKKMPTIWELNKRRMEALLTTAVGGVAIENEIKRFLEKEKAPKSHLEKVIEAFDTEPLTNRYGVWQALSSAAQQQTDMEKKQAFEEMAGRYLAAA